MSDNKTKVEDVDIRLASSLRIAIMRLARRLRAERNDETLTLSQLSALSTLHRRGPLSPSTLAEFERVQPPSMTRIVSVLEERGLVERRPHERDGRASVIALSETGDKILEDDHLRANIWLARVLESFNEEERAALKAVTPIIERLGES